MTAIRQRTLASTPPRFWEGSLQRPLGRFEEAQTRTGEYAPYNAVAVLLVQDGPEPRVLDRAWEILQRRHPLLSARIFKRNGRYFFTCGGGPSILSRLVERDDDNSWMAVVEEELNRRIDVATGPLVRCCYLLPSPDGGRGEIILSFHHAIMDAPSGANLCRELLTLCDILARGGEPEGHEPLPLPPPVEAHLPPRFQGLGGSGRLLLFFLRQMSGEAAHWLRQGGGRRLPSAASTRCRILPVQLSEADTSALFRSARRQRVTVNGAMQAAMLLAVARCRYPGRQVVLRHFLLPNLRPYLDPPISAESLAAYSSLLRLTLRVEVEQDLWSLARAIDARGHAAAKRGDKHLGILASAAVMRTIIALERFRMCETALSYAGSVALEPSYGSIRLLGVHAFVSSFPIGPEYSAQVRLLGGRLWWDIVYVESDMDREQARKIAEDIQSLLRQPCA